MSTNNQTGERTGTLAEMPPAGSQRVGEEWTTPDETLWQVKRDPITGAQTWVAIAGPGAGASAAWPKYVVAPATGPAAPYQTIQSAIDAAVADGHNPNVPTTVLIFPGIYVETVTAAPGVNLIGFASRDGARVVIDGDLAVSFRSPGGVAIENLTVTGELVFGDLLFQELDAFRVRVLGGGGTGVRISNTFPGSAVEFEECELLAVGPESTPLLVGSGVVLRVRDTVIGDNDNGFSISGTGNSGVEFTDCEVHGLMTLNGFTLDAYRTRFRAVDASIATIFAGKHIWLHPGCVLDCNADLVFDGVGGTVILSEPEVLNNLSFSEDLVVESAHTARAHTIQNSETDVAADSVPVDTLFFHNLSAPTTYSLPPSTGGATPTAHEGREIAVVKDASAQTLSIAPAAGDTISYSPLVFGSLVLGAGAAHGAVLRLSRADHRWDVISLY